MFGSETHFGDYSISIKGNENMGKKCIKELIKDSSLYVLTLKNAILSNFTVGFKTRKCRLQLYNWIPKHDWVWFDGLFY